MTRGTLLPITVVPFKSMPRPKDRTHLRLVAVCEFGDEQTMPPMRNGSAWLKKLTCRRKRPTISPRHVGGSGRAVPYGPSMLPTHLRLVPTPPRRLASEPLSRLRESEFFIVTVEEGVGPADLSSRRLLPNHRCRNPRRTEPVSMPRSRPRRLAKASPAGGPSQAAAVQPLSTAGRGSGLSCRPRSLTLPALEAPCQLFIQHQAWRLKQSSRAPIGFLP